MDDAFIFRLAISFFIGGSYIALVTRIAEVAGAKIGAVLSSTPTTALVGMIFVGLAEGADGLESAAPGVIAGFTAVLFFLIAYVNMRRTQTSVVAMLGAIGAWAVVTSMFSVLSINSISWASLLFSVGFIFCNWLFRSIKEVRATRKSSSLQNLLLRATIAGTIVSAVVIATEIGGAFWGGLTSAFPALFISSLIILEREQGETFTISVIKHLPAGMLSVFSYGLAIGLLSTRVGWQTSILLAFAFSLFVSWSVYRYKQQHR